MGMYIKKTIYFAGHVKINYATKRDMLVVVAENTLTVNNRTHTKESSMKKTVVFALALMVLSFTAQAVFAGDISNASNARVGSIGNDGRIFNSGNSQIGKIGSDGRIFDSKNSQIGRIDLSDGRIFNSMNSQIGKIDLSDGRVFNSVNSQIGKIGSDGRVFGSNNAQIGRANGIPNAWAAVFFFFKF